MDGHETVVHTVLMLSLVGVCLLMICSIMLLVLHCYYHSKWRREYKQAVLEASNESDQTTLDASVFEMECPVATVVNVGNERVVDRLDNHKYDHEGTIQTRKYTQVWMQDIRD
jgi:hypothetical protein